MCVGPGVPRGSIPGSDRTSFSFGGHDLSHIRGSYGYGPSTSVGGTVINGGASIAGAAFNGASNGASTSGGGPNAGGGSVSAGGSMGGSGLDGVASGGAGRPPRSSLGSGAPTGLPKTKAMMSGQEALDHKLRMHGLQGKCVSQPSSRS